MNNSRKNIFLVNQKPDSKWDDKECERYNFSASIPNGQQIRSGDILIVNLPKKYAQKMNYGDKRIVGIGEIDEVVLYKFKGEQMKYAVYSWYKKFDPPLMFDDIGGDPRSNIQHAMNKFADEDKLKALLGIIKGKL